MTTSLSERLSHALSTAGMTQRQLASQVSVSAPTVSQWLTGKKRPTSANINSLAQALGTSPSWLEYGQGAATERDPTELRAEHQAATGWRFRGTAPDGGRDYGNANVWAFDPSIEALVRDVVQNCRDAEDVPGAVVSVTFNLVRLKGPALKSYLDALKWSELNPHLKATAQVDQRLGRNIKHQLDSFEAENELLLLVVHDYGTLGLTGDEHKPGHFVALCRNNLDSNKSDNAGGAFGLGKAVLWRSSRFSLVTFASNLSTPTSGGQQAYRVFGRCDLTWHENSEGESFAGPGWFGEITEKSGEQVAQSYWDNPVLARDLYLERRDNTPGTSIAVVGFHDPAADKQAGIEELVESIKDAVTDWFWPDLVDGRLKVTVEAHDGREPILSHTVAGTELRAEYADAFKKWKQRDLSDQLVEEGDVVELRVPLSVPERVDKPRHPALTHEAVLLVRKAGEEQNKKTRPNSVALFRGVQMVVDYLNLRNICMGATPFHAVLVCGEAVDRDPASSSADRFLRTSEPPAHTRWGSTPDLQTEYKRGGVKSISDFISSAKELIRDAVKPSGSDKSDGPKALKELLRIGQPNRTSTDRPRIVRPTATVDAQDGAWLIEANIRLPKCEHQWLVEPVVAFVQESGGSRPVAWKTLECSTGQQAPDGLLVIPPDTTEIRFSGRTAPDTHPVRATESCITVELRRALKGQQGQEND